MKKLLTAAALAASLASTGAYAACSADIDMGGNQITNTTMTALGTSSEVATKAYVDNLMAGSNPVLELSAESSVLNNFGEATAYCVALAGDEANGGSRPWRLPTLEELLVAASSHTNITATTAYVWSATPYNLSTGATTDIDSDGQGLGARYWVLLRFTDGIWDFATGGGAGYVARCVR